MLRYETTITEGTLVRRYKRFLADVELGDGTRVTAHCANPGRMTSCSDPGSPVWLLPGRGRLPFRLEVVVANGVTVGVNPVRANAVVAEALAAGTLARQLDAHLIRREADLPNGGGRVDFLLEATSPRGDPRPLWLEVKSVTLVDRGEARFPDAVTARGRRHLLALAERVLAGDRAAVLYLVQRADAKRVVPAADIDRDYAEAFATALAVGVEAYAFRAEIDRRGIAVGRPLPVDIV